MFIYFDKQTGLPTKLMMTSDEGVGQLNKMEHEVMQVIDTADGWEKLTLGVMNSPETIQVPQVVTPVVPVVTPNGKKKK